MEIYTENQIIERTWNDIFGEQGAPTTGSDTIKFLTTGGLQPGTRLVDLEVENGVFNNCSIKNLTMTPGGYIKYGKTSFTDTTNAGYYISSEGFYIGALGDASKLKYTIADGSFDFVGTISGRSTLTIANSINASGQLVSDIVNNRLDTSAKMILDEFKLATTGALNISGAQTVLTANVAIGDTSIIVSSTTGFPTSGVLYLQGNKNWMKITYTGTTATTFTGIPSSGIGSITEAANEGKQVLGGPGIVITPKGIVAINSSGVETITLEGTTGNATFAGILSAASGTLGTLEITSAGHIKGGQTDYNTGAGFFLGYSGGAYKFSIGNPNSYYLTWDGTDFNIKAKHSNLMSYDAVIDVNGYGDYTDIQSALNDGKTSIYVRKGTYIITSAITILSSNVTITGESWTNTIIKVGDTARCCGIIVGNGATTLTNITISNIQIDGNYQNQFGGANLHGIYLYGSPTNIITKVQISNCYVHDCEHTGIYLFYANNNIITENQVTSNQFDGIVVRYSNYNTIYNNQVNNNINIGIGIAYSSNNIVTGNQASSNSMTGIDISDSFYSIVTENQANSNPNYGIGLEGNSQYNIIMGNQANYNQAWGIISYYSNHNTISDNQTISNTGGGILMYSSSYNVIVENKCTQNGTGISIGTSDCNKNLVVKNYLTGNTTSLYNVGTGTILAASTTNDNIV